MMLHSARLTLPLTRRGAYACNKRDAPRRAARGGLAAGPTNGAVSGAAAELDARHTARPVAHQRGLLASERLRSAIPNRP